MCRHARDERVERGRGREARVKPRRCWWSKEQSRNLAERRSCTRAREGEARQGEGRTVERRPCVREEE